MYTDQCIILAGGYGSRLGKITKKIPKPLLKINNNSDNGFELNTKLILKYFDYLKDEKNPKMRDFERYFNQFYKFCFELPLQNMIRGSINFKY